MFVDTLKNFGLIIDPNAPPINKTVLHFRAAPLNQPYIRLKKKNILPNGKDLYLYSALMKKTHNTETFRLQLDDAVLKLWGHLRQEIRDKIPIPLKISVEFLGTLDEMNYVVDVSW